MYISKFDIQKLQDLPIEQVAEALQISVSSHKAICPFHDDTHASLTFNRARNRYRCYVCDAHGGSIDLVMNSQGWSFSDSCQWLANRFGIVLSDNRDYKPKQLKQQVRAIKPVAEVVERPDIAYLSRLMAQPVLNAEARKFLFDDRKLSPGVVQQLGISSISYNCPMSSSPKPTYFDGPALLIPYRDIDGNLVSVQSRFLGDSHSESHSSSAKPSPSQSPTPRFRFPKGSQCHIFNLDVISTLKEKEPLFITEGVSDCLAILSAGFKAIAIPSATLLKSEDKGLLLSLSQSHTLHMYPDNDEPGEKLYFQLKDLCPGLQRHNLPVGYKDVGQYWASIHK